MRLKSYPASDCRGFTLIAAIAMLAIATGLATMILPNLIRSMQRDTSSVESQTLDALADGVIGYFLDQQGIAGTALGGTGATVIWDDNIATYGDFSATTASINSEDCARLFWVDSLNANLNLTLNATSGDWSQSLEGVPTLKPTLRVMIISDITAKCRGTNPISAITLDAATFNAIWNADFATAPNYIDIDSDAVNGDRKLKIKRIDLSPFFHRVTFRNQPGEVSMRRSHPKTEQVPVLSPALTVHTVNDTQMIFTGIIPNYATIFSSTIYSSGYTLTLVSTPTVALASALSINVATTVAVVGTTILPNANAVNVAGIYSNSTQGLAISTGTPAVASPVTTSNITVDMQHTYTSATTGAETETITSSITDLTLQFGARPWYQVVGTAGVQLTTAPTSNASVVSTIYVVDGTEIKLYNHPSAFASATPLLTVFVTADDNLSYTPSIDSFWSR